MVYLDTQKSVLDGCHATIDAQETLKFEVLSHPPYSPDLAPGAFHFFPHFKRDLKWTHFTSDDEMKQAVTSWIKQRTPEFFIDGIRKLFNAGQNVLNDKATMSEKVCQFVAKILYSASYFRLFKYISLFLDISLCALLFSHVSYFPPPLHTTIFQPWCTISGVEELKILISCMRFLLLSAHPSGRAVYGVGLRPLDFWDCGFESLRRHGCLSVVLCVVR